MKKWKQIRRARKKHDEVTLSENVTRKSDKYKWRVRVNADNNKWGGMGSTIRTTAIDATVINYLLLLLLLLAWHACGVCTLYSYCVPIDSMLCCNVQSAMLRKLYKEHIILHPLEFHQNNYEWENYCSKKRERKQSKLKFIMIMISGAFPGWSSTVDSMIKYGNYFLHGVRVFKFHERLSFDVFIRRFHCVTHTHILPNWKQEPEAIIERSFAWIFSPTFVTTHGDEYQAISMVIERCSGSR